MKWIQVPVAILSLSSTSFAHASSDEREDSAKCAKADDCAELLLKESLASPLQEVLQYFGEKPIRVAAQERAGHNADHECCEKP